VTQGSAKPMKTWLGKSAVAAWAAGAPMSFELEPPTVQR
jgi:hypothetical protein